MNENGSYGDYEVLDKKSKYYSRGISAYCDNLKEKNESWSYGEAFGNHCTYITEIEIMDQTKNNLKKHNHDDIILKNEENSMSYMIMCYNGSKAILATDSRLTYGDGSFKDDKKKIFSNKDKTIFVGIIGLSSFTYELGNSIETTINLSDEIAEFLCEGEAIDEILEKERVKKGHKTYKKLILEKLGSKKLNIVILKENEKPQVINIEIQNQKLKIEKKIYKEKAIYAASSFPSKVNQALIDIYKLNDENINIQEENIKNFFKIVYNTADFFNIKTIGGEIQIITL